MSENWDEFAQVLAGAEFEDDSDDDGFGFVGEDDEDDFDTQFEAAARRGGRRKAPARAVARQRYSQSVQGKGSASITTPRGTAQIALPGRFPTVEEFRKTVDALQLDITKNSSGIKTLGEQQKADIARLTAMHLHTEKKLTKRLKRTQLLAIMGASLPLVMQLLQQQGVFAGSNPPVQS